MAENKMYMLMNAEIEGVPTALVESVNELVPTRVQSGRFLQILVRIKGSRPDKPHDTWYVIQVITQTHRGMDFAAKSKSLHTKSTGDTFTSGSKREKVIIRSGTSVDSSTPKVWTDDKGVINFNVWNAFGKLDNVPIFLDEREYLAIMKAVEKYNEVNESESGRRPSNILQGGTECLR